MPSLGWLDFNLRREPMVIFRRREVGEGDCVPDDEMPSVEITWNNSPVSLPAALWHQVGLDSHVYSMRLGRLPISEYQTICAKIESLRRTAAELDSILRTNALDGIRSVLAGLSPVANPSHRPRKSVGMKDLQLCQLVMNNPDRSCSELASDIFPDVKDYHSNTKEGLTKKLQKIHRNIKEDRDYAWKLFIEVLENEAIRCLPWPLTDRDRPWLRSQIASAIASAHGA